MHAWTWSFPALRPFAETGRLRYRFGKEIWKSGGKAGEELLCAWLARIRKAVDVGFRLGWVFEEEGRRFCMDPAGVLVVLGGKGVVLSCYIPLPTVSLLPPWEKKEARKAAVLFESRRKAPFPREGKWKIRKDVFSWRPLPSSEELLHRFRIFRWASGEVRGRMARSLSKEGKEKEESLSSFLSARKEIEFWMGLMAGEEGWPQ